MIGNINELTENETGEELALFKYINVYDCGQCGYFRCGH